MRTTHYPKFITIHFVAVAISVISVFALSPREQADDFHSRGLAAEQRGEMELAWRYYDLALRAHHDHPDAQAKLKALDRKNLEDSLRKGTAAEAKGDLKGANLHYAMALAADPSSDEATTKLKELEKKMGSDFLTQGRARIVQKLDSIIIPRIDFEDTTLEQAVDFLRLRSAETDLATSDPAKKGIIFKIRKAATGEDPGMLRIRELRVRNIPLAIALKYICDGTKTSYLVNESDVTFVMANDSLAALKDASSQVAPSLAKNSVASSRPSPTPATPTGSPVWKSKDGKSVKGEFVGLDGEAVVIKRDGKEVTIPFTRLDPAGVAQARDFAAVRADVLLHYDFSDGSGAMAKDRSGNGRDGTLVGFADTQSGGGESGATSGWTNKGSLIFDGMDDSVVTPLLTSDLVSGPGFTIEAVLGHRNPSGTWSSIVSTDALSVATGAIVQFGKIAKGNDPSCPESAVFSRVNGFSMPVGKAKKPTTLGDGGLHHVAMTYDSGAGVVRIYFDQRLQGEWRNLKGSILSGSRILIGNNGWAQGEGWFGPISEIRITKRPLTHGQFLDYPKPADQPAPKPIHRYSFNGDTNDSIGTARGKVVDAGSPTARFAEGEFDISTNRGEPSHAITEDAYVDLPNGLVGKFKGRFTLELWCTMTRLDGWITACSFGRTTAPEDVGAGPGDRHSASVQLVLKGQDNDLHSIINTGESFDANERRTDIRPGFDVSTVGAELHYALVIDTSNTSLGPNGSQHLYLDGSLVGTAPLPAGLAAKLDDINNWLGRSLRTNPVFVGKYNEFRVYDRPLTAAEVLSSHIAGPDVIYQAAGPATPKR